MWTILESSVSSSGVSALEGPYFLSRSNIETVSNCCFVNLNPFPLVPQATYQIPSPIESGKIKEKSFSGFVVDFNTSPSSLYLIDASVLIFYHHKSIYQEILCWYETHQDIFSFLQIYSIHEPYCFYYRICKNLYLIKTFKVARCYIGPVRTKTKPQGKHSTN